MTTDEHIAQLWADHAHDPKGRTRTLYACADAIALGVLQGVGGEHDEHRARAWQALAAYRIAAGTAEEVEHLKTAPCPVFPKRLKRVGDTDPRYLDAERLP